MDGVVTMDKMKDLVLLNWANYTMNLITDIASRSDNSEFMELRDKLYSSFFYFKIPTYKVTLQINQTRLFLIMNVCSHKWETHPGHGSL